MSQRYRSSSSEHVSSQKLQTSRIYMKCRLHQAVNERQAHADESGLSLRNVLFVWAELIVNRQNNAVDPHERSEHTEVNEKALKLAKRQLRAVVIELSVSDDHDVAYVHQTVRGDEANDHPSLYELLNRLEEDGLRVDHYSAKT